jgi:hypothetical protein
MACQSRPPVGWRPPRIGLAACIGQAVMDAMAMKTVKSTIVP